MQTPSGPDLRADAVAGLTTAVMLVPQAMGYALLAGLPPTAGLYAALVPLLAYAMFGTSRQLAVGPVAMDSLLTAVAVSAVAAAGSDDYVRAAIVLAALVGVIQLALGLLGLGFVVNFLSRPVLSGFTSAAALIIAASQLGNLFGVSGVRSNYVHEAVLSVASSASDWQLPTLALGVGSVALLVVLERVWPRVPRAMVAVTASTVLCAWLGLDQEGVAIVGAIPAGLPRPVLPALDSGLALSLLPSAATIALVSFIEAISVGKQFARLGRYELDPARELSALGIANVAGAFFGGYPIAGGLSRTAVNAQAGARTKLAGVITALVVALTLLFLTPLFHYLPKATLAAVIVSAVAGLFDAAAARRLWRVKRSDFWLLAATFAATLGLGIQQGILTGVGASLALFLVRTTRPHVAVLGRIPGTQAYLNVARHPHALTAPGVLVVRIDAQFYFGNVTFLKQTLRELEAASPRPLRAVVLDASGINQLDSSALDALAEIDRDYGERGVRLSFSHVKGPVRDVMCRAGLLDTLGRQGRIFLRTHDAVTSALEAEAVPAAEVAPEGEPSRDPRAPPDRVGCGPPPT